MRPTAPHVPKASQRMTSSGVGSRGPKCRPSSHTPVPRTATAARVTSTVRVKSCAYSVPSRLMGEWVKVRIYEDRLVVRYAKRDELDCERLRGRNLKRIDYRHIIWSLVRKPGGFARYVHREEMFPSLVFRRAYDAIQTPHRGTKGDLEYLRILHLAASTLETDVEAALALLLGGDERITVDAVKLLASTGKPIEVPDLERLPVDLTAYDALLGEVGT